MVLYRIQHHSVLKIRFFRLKKGSYSAFAHNLYSNPESIQGWFDKLTINYLS